jgi:hypothetical protein
MTTHPARAEGVGSPRETSAHSIGGAVQPTRYRIAVRGRLSERLGSAFEGLALEPGHEQTVLAGEIRDQAQLYGVLDRIRDLGLELVSVAEDPGRDATV